MDYYEDVYCNECGQQVCQECGCCCNDSCSSCNCPTVEKNAEKRVKRGNMIDTKILSDEELQALEDGGYSCGDCERLVVCRSLGTTEFSFICSSFKSEVTKTKP